MSGTIYYDSTFCNFQVIRPHNNKSEVPNLVVNLDERAEIAALYKIIRRKEKGKR